jgi:DNA invertase Pin-like site-specific DNA recombinase
MKALLPGDTVVVTKLDRLARSSRDLHNIIHELTDRACHATLTAVLKKLTTPAERPVVFPANLPMMGDRRRLIQATSGRAVTRNL